MRMLNWGFILCPWYVSRLFLFFSSSLQASRDRTWKEGEKERILLSHSYSMYSAGDEHEKNTGKRSVH